MHTEKTLHHQHSGSSLKKKSFSERYREDKAKGVKYPGVSDSVKEHLAILEEGTSRSGRNMHIRCTK